MDLIAKLEEAKAKFNKLTDQMSDPSIISDQNRFVAISKERSELEPIVAVYDKYADVVQNLEGNQEIIDANEDDELVEIAKEEMADYKAEKENLEKEIKLLLVPKDPNDDKDILLEIRAGTGGEEAALFAGDLFRMYSRFCELRGWSTEIIELNESGVGGLKEVVLSVQGKNVFADLKFESGVHRVQRVPATESSGRVHTSAASVAVMPEAEDVEVEVDPNDLRIDVYRSGGAGGQNVNKVETAIRITHIPTGLVVQCQDERSQLKNRQKAMKVLKTRLYDLKLAEHNEEIASARKSMVKSGDRSDKIRTYNYPQNRITDHRINLTLYNLSNIVEGDLNELIEKLKLADSAERLGQAQ